MDPAVISNDKNTVYGATVQGKTIIHVNLVC